ncbi:protein polybromo-1 isoform X2 [Chiloscyllium plagiosum]|uniref:protein polybromo-1 isoform X2 n=1 Tax=Chiloscyllium plagiosum TaxID=36176 RepID=UPI001CB80D0C|nr:protein polybromo-1 isoform X2 [Chiloscyllium plagiosum]
MEEYDDVDQLTSDFQLMVNNAKAYYKEDSAECKAASKLWDLYTRTRNEFVQRGDYEDEEEEDDYDGQDNPGTTGDEDSATHYNNLKEQLEHLFEAVATYVDPTGHLISELFQKLPSKVQYPDYYEIIKEPIDLKTIAQRIQNGFYKSVNAMARDIELLVRNAKTYNEPGSPIFKDANTIKKVFNQKRAELEHNLEPTKSSLRIRNRRSAQGDRLSAITMALQYGSESEEESGLGAVTRYEDGDSEGESIGSSVDVTSPLYQLYEVVRSYRNSQGQLLAEPFLRLPSKKDYPDYYQQIKNPMSLQQIRQKLKNNEFENLDQMEADMNLMFENAKRYNIPNSAIFKRVLKLQQIMQAKRKELARREYTEDGDSMVSSVTSDTGSAKRKRLMIKYTHRFLNSSIKKLEKNRRKTESQLKHRLKVLYNTIVESCDPTTGRRYCELFLVKPSKKDYPDYYKVILEPIDLKMLEHNIRSEKYTSEEAFIDDLKLMFRNARHYNEEGSQVYNDATILEKILKEKRKELGPLLDDDTASPKLKLSRKSGISPKKSKYLTPLQQKLNELYEAVKNYTDNRGRRLSAIFLRLPTRSELPDYYLTIKKPIDMEKVKSHMMSNKYQDVDSLVDEFVLMFNNACTYNEPESLIYKDALVLHKVLLEAKKDLDGDDDAHIPNVKLLIQELIHNLFVSVLSHQDDEGRCYSDSLAEIPATDPSIPNKPPLTFDIIRKNIETNRYGRLDVFQEHMFEVLERARRLNRTDSEIYEDAVELQHFFIKIRDELCKNGEILLSPALSYTMKHLQHDLEKEKKEKLPKEIEEDKQKREEEKKELSESEKNMNDDHSGSHGTYGIQRTYSQDCSFKDNMYHVGDYVYVEPAEPNLLPHIVCIERLWEDDTGEKWLYGCWFYRPNETFHLATRKFLEKEVFKSDYYNKVLVSKILGKCVVMFVKEYFKIRPEGFGDEDVFVCESRYSAKTKSFKKIKLWTMPLSAVKFVPRNTPLPVVRVASVFANADKTENKESIEPMAEESKGDENNSIIDKEREDVPVEISNGEPGCQYYEQLHYNDLWLKVGDCVYIKSHGLVQPRVGRIEKMWVRGGAAYFFGPIFIHPEETEHEPTKMFYKKEVFLSNVEETCTMTCVIGKCSVLSFKDYLSCRPTEVNENDVYICESRYNETDKQMKRFKGLKRFSLSAKILDDEIYYFRKLIVPQKEPSPLLDKKIQELEMKFAEFEEPDEDHEECIEEEVETAEQPSVPQLQTPVTNEMEIAPYTPPQSTPKSIKGTKQKEGKRKTNPSGYILFSSEMRAVIKAKHPDFSFGELSRLVGTEWRNLEAVKKAEYEERAAKQAEQQERERAAQQQQCASPRAGTPVGAIMGVVPPPTPMGILHQQMTPVTGVIGQSVTTMVGGSPTVTTTGTPYGQQIGIHPNLGAQGQQAPPPYPTQVTAQQTIQQQPSTPMFVAPPPKTQRLLHSEAYLRYIEGLSADCNTVSKWDQSLSARRQDVHLTKEQESRLPSHWLKSKGAHTTMVDALWRLRDIMLRDTLNIRHAYSLE